MSQEHNTAAKQLAEHAQMFAEFVEQQRKNRAKVTRKQSLLVAVRFIFCVTVCVTVCDGHFSAVVSWMK